MPGWCTALSSAACITAQLERGNATGNVIKAAWPGTTAVHLAVQGALQSCSPGTASARYVLCMFWCRPPCFQGASCQCLLPAAWIWQSNPTGHRHPKNHVLVCVSESYTQQSRPRLACLQAIPLTATITYTDSDSAYMALQQALSAHSPAIVPPVAKPLVLVGPYGPACSKSALLDRLLKKHGDVFTCPQHITTQPQPAAVAGGTKAAGLTLKVCSASTAHVIATVMVVS